MTWKDRLKRAVESCWEYHGPASAIGWFHSRDLFGKEVIVGFPAFQEIIGGKSDGKKVWVGFRLSVTELLKVENLTVSHIEVSSPCSHCNPHPLLDLAGTFEGNDFNLIVLLEPKYDTDAAELRDAATQTLRPIKRGTQT